MTPEPLTDLRLRPSSHLWALWWLGCASAFPSWAAGCGFRGQEVGAELPPTQGLRVLSRHSRAASPAIDFATSKANLLEELRRLVTAHIVVSLEHRKRPFSDLPKAPQR